MLPVAAKRELVVEGSKVVAAVGGGGLTSPVKVAKAGLFPEAAACILLMAKAWLALIRRCSLWRPSDDDEDEE